MADNMDCCCGKLKYSVVMACSGAADVGAISDLTARALARDKTALMSCGIGVAVGVEQIVEKTAGASKVLVIDGCDQDCANKAAMKGGIPNFTHLRLTDLGMEKGKTPVSEENTGKALAAAKACFADANAC